jgi:hypothetical protein
MKRQKVTTAEQEAEPSLLAINNLARQAGLSTVTVWRWRKNGWLRTTNIAGRQYLTREDLAEFKRRAAAGEFQREHKFPRRMSVSDRTLATATNIPVQAPNNFAAHPAKKCAAKNLQLCQTLPRSSETASSLKTGLPPELR